MLETKIFEVRTEKHSSSRFEQTVTADVHEDESPTPTFQKGSKISKIEVFRDYCSAGINFLHCAAVPVMNALPCMLMSILFYFLSISCGSFKIFKV